MFPEFSVSSPDFLKRCVHGLIAHPPPVLSLHWDSAFYHFSPNETLMATVAGLPSKRLQPDLGYSLLSAAKQKSARCARCTELHLLRLIPVPPALPPDHPSFQHDTGTAEVRVTQLNVVTAGDLGTDRGSLRPSAALIHGSHSTPS